MATEELVEIVSTETIKPSSPTPTHLKTFKLSLFDQLTPPVFSKLVYFYLPSPQSNSQLLKTSLSQTLSLFYPFSGRIKSNLTIECNDDGAIFVESRSRFSLSEILKNPSDQVVTQFLPLNPQFHVESDSGRPLLLIQSTSFVCGGSAIGVLFFHKIADAAAMAAFITAWAVAGKVAPPELLTGPSLFPPKDFFSNLKLPTGTSEKISTKRFVFTASKIDSLKLKVSTNSDEQVQKVTRVESVSALIWKCATKAAKSNSNEKEASILFQSVNLRKRFDPPLPENSTGNIIGYYPVEFSGDDVESDNVKLDTVVGLLKKGLIEFCEGYVKKLQEERESSSSAILERSKLFDRKDAKIYTVTSWCRFPVKEADFGFGKPVWVCTACIPFKNIVVLMDSSDGLGIEAFVSLKDEEMDLFERDGELLEFASVNPPIQTGV